MKTLSTCFSLLQNPRIIKLDSFSSFWRGRSFSKLIKNFNNSYSSGPCLSNILVSEVQHTKPSIKRSATSKNFPRATKTETKHEILKEAVLTSTELSKKKSDAIEFQGLQEPETQPKFDVDNVSAHLVTVIIFDIETTGFCRRMSRIIDIAFRDLAGGKNSTFHTLVNPGCDVRNAFIHGIQSYMVNRPDIPRMQDLIPILLKYVNSRKKTGGTVLFVAHNARCFDVPFLINEFSRCSVEIPKDWQFLDSLLLARELFKAGGLGAGSKLSLSSLREHYGIVSDSPAHRAMSDVNVLSLILQRLTSDLKITIPGLLARSFAVSELISTDMKKKKTVTKKIG